MAANKNIPYETGDFYVPNNEFTKVGWTFVNWKQVGDDKDGAIYDPSATIAQKSLSSKDRDVVTLVHSGQKQHIKLHIMLMVELEQWHHRQIYHMTIL